MIKYILILSFYFTTVIFPQSFFPLHTGDKHYSWYHHLYYYWYIGQGEWFDSTYFDSTTVLDSVIVNNNIYKKLWGSYYYLSQDNKLYTLVNSEEKLAMDFNKLDGGDTLYYDGLKLYYNYMGIDSLLFGNSYQKQFQVYYYKFTTDPNWYYPEQLEQRWIKFIKNAGQIDQFLKGTYFDPDLQFGSIHQRITYYIISNGEEFNLLKIPTLNICKIISDDSIKIKFKDNGLPFEDGFIIERKEFNEPEFTQIAILDSSTKIFFDTNFEMLKSYEYRVKSFVDTVVSYPSNVRSVTTILPPTNLAADTSETGKLIITWDYNSQVEPSFIIERKTKIGWSEWGDYIVLDTLASFPHAYADTSVDLSKPNKYRIKAVIDTIESPYSEGLVILPVLLPPENITVTINEYESVKLTWAQNPNCTWYHIQRRKVPGNSFFPLSNGNCPDTVYVDENIDEEETYEYRIWLSNDFVQSTYGDTVGIYVPPFQPIYSPSHFTARLINQDSVKLSWVDNSSNEKYFKIYRGKDSLSLNNIREVPLNTITYVDTIPILSGPDAELWYGVRAENPHSQSDLVLYHLNITDVSKDKNQLPTTFNISQNYPNPFNPSTVINYDLPEQTHVQIIIYNVLGERIETLVDEVKQAGRYSVTFNSSNYSSGVYYYRITAGEYKKTKKMLLMK